MANDSKLTRFGQQFQIKIISALLEDKVFLQTIHDIIESSYFESDANKWLVGTIIGYYLKYKKSITLEVMKVKIDGIDDEVLKVSVIENLGNAWRNINATDLEFIKSETIDFCKNQVLKNAIVQSVDLLQNGDYEGIKKLIDDALKAGAERDLGHDYTTGIEDRLLKSVRNTIITPWDPINDIMDGGLGKGELGVVVAPAGIGKTWCLQSIAANALKKGMTIVHYTLELNQEYVGLRYDSIISGIPTANIKFYKDEVKKKVEALKGKLLIKYFPTKSASVQTLSAHLKTIELQQIKPDIVIVDYADILRGPGTEKRYILENIYEDLRGLAGEYDLPIWTASQANRSSLEEEIIDATKVAEAYSKVMISDFVISISRKVEDKIANTGRFHVIKNRFGIDGITFPTSMNTSTGNIQIYEATTQSGREMQSKMNNSEEYLRKQLSQKHEEFQKDMEGFE